MKQTNPAPARVPLSKLFPVSTDEVRASVRFPIHLPVDIEPEGDAPLRATTQNISASGLLLTVDRELPANQRIEFTIQMPADVLGTETDVLVHGKGRVVRCTGNSAAAVIDDYTLEAVSAGHDASKRTH